MKYKRTWCFGGDHKDGEGDFVTAYTAENGTEIKVEFCISNQAMRGYVVNGKGFSTLREAKHEAEREMIQAHPAG